MMKEKKLFSTEKGGNDKEKSKEKKRKRKAEGNEEVSEILENIKNEPKSPEQASKEIQNKAEKASEEIKNTAEEHKETEETAAKGETIYGEEKINKKREKVVKESEKKLDSITKSESISEKKLYGQVMDFFRDKYGSKIPQVGWEAEYNGEKRTIIEVIDNDGEIWVKYKSEFLDDIKNEFSGEKKPKTETEIKKEKSKTKIKSGKKEKKEKIKEDIESEKSVEKEVNIFEKDVIDAFVEFSISENDLEDIEGFKDLNIGGQLLVAKNLKNIAFEEAKFEVKDKQQSAYKGKNFLSKLGVGISNVFKKRGQEKLAIEKQKLGGLEKNKVNLENYISLIKSMELKGETVNGKEFFEFANIESMGPEKQEVYSKFNEAANLWAEIPEHFNEKYASKEQKKQYKKALENYQKTKEELLLGEDIKKAGEVNNIDLQISLLKTMKADPDIEKDWNNMGKSSLKKFFSNLDKPAYLVAGYGARALTASLVGTVAVPLTAAGLGAWRGFEKGKKHLRESDKDKSKKEQLSDSKLFKDRSEAYNKLQEFYNNESEINVNEKGERIVSEELESKPEYQEALKEYKRLDEKLNEVSEKSIDKKTESAEQLSDKFDKLITYYNTPKKGETKKEKEKRKAEALKMIDNRLKFSKDKLAKDLINFGSSQEKAKNLLNFYQKMSNAEIFLKTEVESYSSDFLERADYKARGESININERIEKALEKYEEITEKKLSKNRKSFIFKKVKNGALMSGAFALAGVGIREGVEAFKELGDEAVEEISENINNEIIYANNEPIVSESLDKSEWSDNLSKVISNEGLRPGQTDSVWRSSRILFMENAKDLGYEGDINDTASLRNWADSQVAKAINRTDDIKDLVHEGNTISLVKDQNGEMIIKIDKGAGELEPSYLPEKEVEIERDVNIPKRMESISATGLETQRPSIAGLENDEAIRVEESETVDKEIIDDISETEKASIEDEKEEFKEPDALKSDLESIGKEGGLKSDVEKTLDKWGNVLEEKREVGGIEGTPESPVIEEGGEAVETNQIIDDQAMKVDDELGGEKNEDSVIASPEESLSKNKSSTEEVNLENQVDNNIAEKLAFNWTLRVEANDLVDCLYKIKDNDLFNNVEKIQDLYKVFDEEIILQGEKWSLADYFKHVTGISHEDLAIEDKEEFLKSVADVVYTQKTGSLESRKIDMFNVLKNIIKKY